MPPLRNEVPGTTLLGFRWDGPFRLDRAEDVRTAFEGWGRTLRTAKERSGKVPDSAPARVHLRRAGISAARYKPSCEALVERLLAGEVPASSLPAVDANNLVSTTILLPLGLYDYDALRDPVVYRKGVAGEALDSMAKGSFDLAGRAALFDAEGPFGSTVSDSVRTRVTAATTRWLWIAYALPGDLGAVEQAMSEGIASWWEAAEPPVLLFAEAAA